MSTEKRIHSLGDDPAGQQPGPLSALLRASIPLSMSPRSSVAHAIARSPTPACSHSLSLLTVFVADACATIAVHLCSPFPFPFDTGSPAHSPSVPQAQTPAPTPSLSLSHSQSSCSHCSPCTSLSSALCSVFIASGISSLATCSTLAIICASLPACSAVRSRAQVREVELRVRFVLRRASTSGWPPACECRGQCMYIRFYYCLAVWEPVSWP
ncbi:hypothetical protein FIBSPDRAFT_870398 [Athelia psychrophila]|uniref:Uncharacterized protein n=1 Tax=Athelia psychrophila TaxID=1759441 RepID=A0A166B718_9AGAM|nr:hypothetical protein FIBSPDRAFT_870398 [Fibularhizoctonia sp. CBS 109695]